MFRFPLRRLAAILTLIFFIMSMALPYCAMAFDGSQWFNGGQAIGDTTLASKAQNTQLPQELPNNCSVKIGKPVILSTGEETYACVDLFVPGRGMDIEIRHTYHSGKNFNLQFGYGWMMNYYYRLQVLDTNNVIILGGDGQKDEFTFNGQNNQYIPPPGVFETLKFDNMNASWTLTKVHGDTMVFDNNGNLAAMVDRNGNKITFGYDLKKGRVPIIGASPYSQTPNARIVVAFDYLLTQITDTLGKVINLAYNADNRLTTITDSTGRVVIFNYDPQTDDLLSITKPASAQYPKGLVKTFTYTAPHLLSTITDPKGQTFVTNHYDGQGRVSSQDLGQGTFNFSYAANQTTVTDPDGNVSIYKFDANGNVLSKEDFTKGLRGADPASFMTKYTYNMDMLRTSTTYPKGNGVAFVYDSANMNPRFKKNLLQVRQKADMTLGDNNANDNVWLMTYEPDFGFINTITDPNGHVTTDTYDYQLPLNDPRYGTKGNLVRIVKGP